MRKYLLSYENWILKEFLRPLKEIDKKDLMIELKNQIDFIQHERFVHLIITIATFILFLISGFILAIKLNIITVMLFVVMLTILIFYIIYYCFLENKVQFWYSLYFSFSKKEK